MATLIGVYNSGGCVGRCDARCYDAQHDHCDCICGGLNHGAGIELASDKTRALAVDQLADIEKRGGFIAPELLQGSLL